MADDLKKYLKDRHFNKTLNRYKKKFGGKKIVVYGTGLLFETITQNYDLSGLDIIAVSDRKYSVTKPDTYLGFNTVAPDNIKDLKPDIVLVSVLRSVVVIENLRYDILDGTGIKVYPMVDRHLTEILKEIWY